METRNRSNRSRPLITQIQNNTTLWIGHLQTDPTDHFAGQTFRCPLSGDLDNIQIFSSAVQNPGQLTLSVHLFDPENRCWGPLHLMGKNGTPIQSIKPAITTAISAWHTK
jgi:hypothetical protein